MSHEPFTLLPYDLGVSFETARSRFGKFKSKWGNGNVVSCKGVQFLSCEISIAGKNNRIEIEEGSKFSHCSIRIIGSDNLIHIGKDACCNHLSIYVHDENNEIKIGEGFYCSGDSGLRVSEGTRLIMGKNIVLAMGFMAMTGDSHSVLDPWGRRVNFAKDIHVADHVWFGYRVTLLKGASIAKGCVVGAGSVVTKAFDEDHVLIAGNPAKVVKRIGGWHHRKLKKGISPLDID